MMLTGLLGWPVAHSRSPGMHNAAFAAAGIAGVYLPLAVPPERLAAAVQGLVALGFRGVNVTIPHKQAVIPLLDDLTPAARAIGAVNTILVREDGRLYGDNTDAPGFIADLTEQGVVLADIAAEGALVLGAGGSARAVVFALATAGVPVTVWARRAEQAQALCDGLRPFLPSAVVLQVLPPTAPTPGRPALIVNCTPVGMEPQVGVSPWPSSWALHPGQIVYDLVYNPPHTRLLQQAAAHGARGINGLGMLLHQGALAWELWTGRPAPLAAMRRALWPS